jgi:hypothetical protein
MEIEQTSALAMGFLLQEWPQVRVPNADSQLAEAICAQQDPCGEVFFPLRPAVFRTTEFTAQNLNAGKS